MVSSIPAQAEPQKRRGNDPISWYLQNIGRVPLLTPAEEIELGNQVQKMMILTEDGQLNVKATRVATVDSPDIRLQGEKILIKSDNQINIISKGFLELKSGFTLSASFADDNFGTMSKVLKAATTITPPTL